MRRAIYLLMACLTVWTSGAGAADDKTARYALLLANHVRGQSVDYRGLLAHRDELNACVRDFAALPEYTFAGWTVPERLAYLINFYNLTVLKIVVEDYPISSIRKAGGWFSGDPFEWRSLTLFGHPISLNLLLDNYIRRDYAEPAVHFALCQAARGSPPLRAEPYVGARLDEQLADQARIFLQRLPHNRIDKQRKRMHLSRIFDWYRADFIRRAGSVEAYIRMISPPDWGLREVPGKFSVSYTDFDWRLNDAAALRP